MKKGFTLIELLTVIAVLGVVAIITAPTVISVIKSSQEKAFIDSATGLTNTARTYQMNNNEGQDLIISFSNGTPSPAIQTKGDLPDEGVIHVDNSGKVEYALWNEKLKKCLVKTMTEKKGTVKTTVTSSSNCKL